MASRLVARSRRGLALALSRAGAGAPSRPSPPGLGKTLGYEPTSHLHGAQFLPCWFSTIASNGSHMQKAQETCKPVAGMEHSDALKVMEGTSPKVVAFSPLEAAITKPRSSPLTIESSKVKRSEIATLVTFYMIPSLLVSSKNGLAASILVGAVFHQIYMFHKEIFLDYVHHDITRKWALIYFKLLLLIMAKETIDQSSLVNTLEFPNNLQYPTTFRKPNSLEIHDTSHVHVRAEKTAFQLSSARLNCRLDPAAAMFTRDGRPDGGDPIGCHAHMPGDRRPPVLTISYYHHHMGGFARVDLRPRGPEPSEDE
uniref:Uncharacterized protein n=1 Tax=Oryza glumipatula TaxID=40148 RepID=A0A0D9ZYB6_9ORYZ